MSWFLASSLSVSSLLLSRRRAVRSERALFPSFNHVTGLISSRMRCICLGKRCPGFILGAIPELRACGFLLPGRRSISSTRTLSERRIRTDFSEQSLPPVVLFSGRGDADPHTSRMITGFYPRQPRDGLFLSALSWHLYTKLLSDRRKTGQRSLTKRTAARPRRWSMQP